MITDIAHSRGPISIVRIAGMGIQLKRLEAINVVKDTTTRSTRTLTSTSRANSMSREGRLMTTCGDMNPRLILYITCFTGSEEMAV